MSPYRTNAPPSPEPLSRRQRVHRLVLAFALTLTTITACKGALPIIAAALTASQLACAFESSLTDASALADACAIDKALVPDLQNLIAEREGAKKAGVVWHKVDAGAGDSSTPSAP